MFLLLCKISTIDRGFCRTRVFGTVVAGFVSHGAWFPQPRYAVRFVSRPWARVVVGASRWVANCLGNLERVGLSHPPGSFVGSKCLMQPPGIHGFPCLFRPLSGEILFFALPHVFRPVCWDLSWETSVLNCMRILCFVQSIFSLETLSPSFFVVMERVSHGFFP